MRARLPVLTLLLLAVGACGGPSVPQPGSEAYLEASGAFYSGVGAMQIGDDLRARARLERVTEIVPSEQAAWSNLALLALRRGEIAEAVAAAERSLDGPISNPAIPYLAALVFLADADSARAEALLRESPGHLRSRVLLARMLADSEASMVALNEARDLAPDNVALGWEMARTRAASGMPEQARGWLAETRSSLPPHPNPDVLSQAFEAALSAADPALPSALDRLRNVLIRASWYRDALDALQAPPELVSEPIPAPTTLEPVPASAAPADRSLALEPNPLPVDRSGWTWSAAVHLGEDALPSVILGDERGIHLPDGTLIPVPGAVAHVEAQDVDQDYRTDLILAGAFGVRVFFQSDAGFLERRGAVPSLGPALFVVAVDHDMEGDLDLLVGFPGKEGLVLRNRGDGSFETGQRIPVASMVDAVWGDLDADGDPDLVTRDTDGRTTFHENRRNGRWAPPAEIARDLRGMALEDADRNGVFELAAVSKADTRRYRFQNGAFVEEDVLRRFVGNAPGVLPASPDGLILTELDNNGALDWLITHPGGVTAFLAEDAELLGTGLDLAAFELDTVAPLTEEGPPELIGREHGEAMVYFPQGEAGYQWKRLRPRAASAQGDRRINTFAIGGDVELRSGLLYQKRPISGQVLHFGLGENLLTEVARITWPNGDLQIEFDLLSDETVLAEQRLKGSCPWVFTHDGERYRFVTDFLWRSPLGLRINAQETAGIATTSDWIRIPGDALSARDGAYEVRITAELWETHFFDQVSLVAVDHPQGTEALVDERFAFPPPDDRVHLFETPQPFAEVRDARGRDASAEAKARDGQYVAGFARGAYQGIAEMHAVEMRLPDSAPDDVRFIGFGWVRPTDSSINVAIGQGDTPAPVSLQLEVPNGAGGWRLVQPDVGFPSGKEKTVLIDLSGIWNPGESRVFRLRTNLEVYWDQLRWGAPAYGEVTRRLLDTQSAQLRYRGFSQVAAVDSVSPELPDYQVLESSYPVRQDLRGFHTRFGDVMELVNQVDDRYVIMNAGDEMVLRFEALEPPPSGWTRDFLLLGDGWVKDGDLNTTFSTTVLPLPTHASADYSAPPTTLEDDPVYQAHPEDWEQFHTRYVSPDRHRKALPTNR
ncbi:MAG: hypothetical protein HKN29_04710 [Rhodothermales bacterium]|nr:hypothetical protein [Rhodothermales bacterium]